MRMEKCTISVGLDGVNDNDMKRVKGEVVNIIITSAPLNFGITFTITDGYSYTIGEYGRLRNLITLTSLFDGEMCKDYISWKDVCKNVAGLLKSRFNNSRITCEYVMVDGYVL